MTALEALRGLRQPDQRSCGPSSLVAARMLVDDGYRPSSFAAAVLALHRELTAPVAFGRLQVPWPRALGTPPWAAARAMTVATGLRYRTRVVRLGDRSGAFTAVLDAVGAGHPCPLYVGSAWLPRHVVLAAASGAPRGDGVEVYDPARGTVTELTRASFEAGRLTATGRWRRPWFALAPV